MMHNVDYLCIAVRLIYRGKNKDYEKIVQFFLIPYTFQVIDYNEVLQVF